MILGKVTQLVSLPPNHTISEVTAAITFTTNVDSPTNTLDVETIDASSPLIGVDLSGAAGVGFLDVDSIDADPSPFGPDLFDAAAAALLGVETFADLREADGTLVDTLDNAFAVRFQVALNETGAGSLTVPADDPVVAGLTVGREIWCWVHSTHVFTYRIDGQPKPRQIQQGEEVQQVYEVSGKGVGSAFGGARIYPQKGVNDPLLGQHRIYSFASIDFPNAGTWGPAVVLNRQDFLDPIRHDFIEYDTIINGQPEITETDAVTAPLEWPVPSADWIWGQADTTPLGFNYFRKVITLTVQTTVNIAVTADNYYTLYLDGTPILGDTGNEGFTWKQHREVQIVLPAGDYTFAAAVENIDNGMTNPAAFLFAAYTVDDNGAVVSILAISDASWIALPYPASVPGWTPGQVLLDALAEVQARGGMTGWTCDFTAVTDSHGNSWVTQDGSGPYMPMFSVPVGSSMADMQSALVNQGRIYWRVSPAGHVLQAFNYGEIRTPLATLAVTGDVATQNILAMESTPSDPPQTALLVKWSNGLFDVNNPTAVGSYGRIEGYITIDAANVVEATRQANVILADVTTASFSHVISVDPVNDTDCPMIAFTVGDFVTAPNEVLTATSMRCWSVSVGQTDMGRATFSLEINRRVKPGDVENQELLQTIGRGVVGSAVVKNTSALSTTNPVRR